MHHPYALFLPCSEQSAGVLAAVELVSTEPDITKDQFEAAYTILMEAAEEKLGKCNVSNSLLIEAASILLGEMGCSSKEYRTLRMRLATVKKKPGGGNAGGGGKAGGGQRQRSHGDGERQRSR